MCIRDRSVRGVNFIPESLTAAGIYIQLFGDSVSQSGGAIHTSGAAANTNTLTCYRRSILTSSGTAGNSAEWFWSSVTLYTRGNAAGVGGFKFVFRGGTSTALGQQRAFWGMQASNAALANANPDQLVNCFGIGYNSGDTNLSVIHNDAAGVATKTSLGASFPVDTVSAYEITLSCGPGASSMEYRVVRLNNLAIATGSVSTDLPDNTIFLTRHLWVNNGTTASAVVHHMIFHAMEYAR